MCGWRSPLIESAVWTVTVAPHSHTMSRICVSDTGAPRSVLGRHPRRVHPLDAGQLPACVAAARYVEHRAQHRPRLRRTHVLADLDVLAVRRLGQEVVQHDPALGAVALDARVQLTQAR